MPLVESSDYRPPLLFRNTYVNTIYTSLVRKVEDLIYTRERIATPDQDFLDLDWADKGNDRLLVVLHGLESSANRAYIKGLIRCFNLNGWDGVGMNFRGCSGENNLSLRTYHVGETSDLQVVLEHILRLNRYHTIALAGFSLGGNVVLKYLGEQGEQIFPEIKVAVAVSVPCHVPSANIEFNRRRNWMYLRRFLKTLNHKMYEKAAQWPGHLDIKKPNPRSFDEFDEAFTAPVHGFKNAEDYWTRNSSLQFIPNIKLPTLLINAQDDTFLSPQCFPKKEAKEMPNFYLAMPKWGGHCGFYTPTKDNVLWSEKTALTFVEQMTAN
jgi:predicted alpha/beta-fold hydrolase